MTVSENDGEVSSEELKSTINWSRGSGWDPPGLEQRLCATRHNWMIFRRHLKFGVMCRYLKGTGKGKKHASENCKVPLVRGRNKIKVKRVA